jgi:hypothetical protein
MNFIKKYLKSLIIDNKLIKTYCRQILIHLSTIDYLYKNLDKLSPVTPLTINTPETKDMVFISKAKTLQKERYSLPSIHTLTISPLNKAESFLLNKLLPDNIQLTIVDSSKLYVIEHMIFPTFMTQRFAGYLPSTYIEFFQKKYYLLDQETKKIAFLLQILIVDGRTYQCAISIK